VTGGKVVRASPDLIFANGGTGVMALLRGKAFYRFLFVWPGDPVTTG